MKNPIDVDVAIIGGGPAGSAAALALLSYTDRKVLLVERSAFEAPRPAEAVTSAISPLLRFLHVEPALSVRSARPAGDAAAAWGGAEPRCHPGLFIGEGEGFVVDRRAFDASLCEAVKARGGGVLLRHELFRAEWVDGLDGVHWNLLFTNTAGTGSEHVAVRARYAIDASGRRACLARQLGVRAHREDALAGVSLRFSPQASSSAALASGSSVDRVEPAQILVEAAPDGWWYSALEPDGQLLAVFMTEASIVRDLRLGERDGIRAALLQAPLTRARVAGRLAPDAPHVLSACSRRLTEVSGPGWVATGAAVASFDPISAMGLEHALWSGTQAARLVEDCLLGPSELGEEYAADLQQRYQHYLQLRQRYYRLEQRWAERPFWRARHDPDSRRRPLTTEAESFFSY